MTPTAPSMTPPTDYYPYPPQTCNMLFEFMSTPIIGSNGAPAECGHYHLLHVTHRPQPCQVELLLRHTCMSTAQSMRQREQASTLSACRRKQCMEIGQGSDLMLPPVSSSTSMRCTMLSVTCSAAATAAASLASATAACMPQCRLADGSVTQPKTPFQKLSGMATAVVPVIWHSKVL